MRLDRRVVLLALVLAYMLTFRLLVLPDRRAAAGAREAAAAAERELRSLLDLRIRYEQQREDLETFLGQVDTTAFLPVIEARINELALAPKLKSIASVGRELVSGVRAAGFDLRLEGLDLREAVLLLEALEGERGLHLDRVVLDRDRDGRSLTVRVRVFTIRRS